MVFPLAGVPQRTTRDITLFFYNKVVGYINCIAISILIIHRVTQASVRKVFVGELRHQHLKLLNFLLQILDLPPLPPQNSHKIVYQLLLLLKFVPKAHL